MPVYSFSQIQLYRTCPLRYRLKYIDKLKPAEFVLSPDLALGKAVHYALEQLYKTLNAYGDVTVDQLTGWFQQSMDQQWPEVPEDIDRSQYQQRGYAYLHEYRNQYAPFDKVRVIATEKQIVFSLDQNEQVKFRGVIDRVDKTDNGLLITDYKTGKHLPDGDQQKYQEQLTLYALGIKDKYGKYGSELKAHIHYLHFNVIDEWEIGKEQEDAVREEFIGQVDQIQSQLFKYNMGDKQAFPAEENPGCKYCEYRDICPLWTHLNMDDEIIPELGESTVQHLIEEYGKLDEQKKQIKKQQDAIKDNLKTYAIANNLQNLFGETYQVAISSKPNYKIIDKERLQEILDAKKVVMEYLSIDRYKINDALIQGTLREDELQGSVRKDDTVTIRVKKRPQDK